MKRLHNSDESPGESQEQSGISNSLRGSLKRPALIVTGYLLLWFVLNLVTEHVQGELAVSLWYPPAGLSFAFLLICGIRYAPAVVLTALVQYLLHRGGPEYPVWLLLSLPVLYTAVYVGATVLLMRGIKIDPRLPRMRDLLYFVGIGCLAAPFVASAVAVTGYAIVGQVPWNEFVINVLGGAAGEATGVGVLTTLLIIAMRPFPQLWSFGPDEALRGFSLPKRQEIPEVLGQTLLLAVTLFVAYGTDRGVRLDFAYLVFLPLIWVALRSNLARTLVCVLVINVGAVLLIGGPVEGTNPILIQFGLVTLTIVGLLLGGLVTERQETSERLVREASHDHLTGLPSRTLFSDALSDELSHPSDDRSDNSSSGGFAVLAVGLDQFANVTNAFGHETGDRVLVAVAERLYGFADEAASAEASTMLSTVRVARTGEDAFAVLIEGVNSDSQAGSLAERLLEELALPYEIEGPKTPATEVYATKVYATASAGVVVVGEASEETNNLLRDAHTA
ncbi:MAG: diguanylate cyclase, partial [Rubrobacteraceae bacterium]